MASKKKPEGLQIVLCQVLVAFLTLITLVPLMAFMGLSSPTLELAIGVIVFGAWFLVMAHRLHAGVRRGNPVKPLRLFLQSNNYLALVFVALAVDSVLALPTLFG